MLEKLFGKLFVSRFVLICNLIIVLISLWRQILSLFGLSFIVKKYVLYIKKIYVSTNYNKRFNILKKNQFNNATSAKDVYNDNLWNLIFKYQCKLNRFILLINLQSKAYSNIYRYFIILLTQLHYAYF